MIKKLFHSIKYRSDFNKRISKNKLTSNFKIKSIRVVLDKTLPVDEIYFRNLLNEITDSKIYFTFIKFSNLKENILKESYKFFWKFYG